jgi:hypothetical protein
MKESSRSLAVLLLYPASLSIAFSAAMLTQDSSDDQVQQLYELMQAIQQRRGGSEGDTES